MALDLMVGEVDADGKLLLRVKEGRVPVVEASDCLKTSGNRSNEPVPGLNVRRKTGCDGSPIKLENQGSP